MPMDDYSSNQRIFEREYQKRAIALHIMRMKRKQLLDVAYYFFGDSKESLARSWSESLAGRQDAVNAFLERFPMEPKTLNRISDAMVHDTIDPIRQSKMSR